MSTSAQASTGRSTKNTQASSALRAHASARPITSITGPRIIGRKPVVIAFWMTVTSVVMRVTRLDVSK